MSISFSVFILSTSLLLLSAEDSFAFSRPAESATFALFSSGVSLLIFSFVVSPGRTAKDDRTCPDTPFSDFLLNTRSTLPLRCDAAEKLRRLTGAKIRQTGIVIVFAVAALCLRVELYRQLVTRSHCGSISSLTFMPLVLAVYEYFLSKTRSSGDQTFSDKIQKKHFNYISSTVLLAIAGIFTAALKYGRESTFICPSLGHDSGITLSFQLLAVVLEISFALALESLVSCAARGLDGTAWQVSTLWGTVLLAAGVVRAVIEVIILKVSNSPMLPPLSASYVEDTLRQSALIAISCVAASKAVISLGVFLTLAFSHNNVTAYHPISILISGAKREHEIWIQKASNSMNLKEAVAEYRKRYHQAPPPGFDLWYEYAINRSSPIIDDYDQIYDDLLPFRALSPKHLRELVLLMTSDQWNDVSAVNIRDGKAEAQADIKPTHRWMIEGIALMIEPFAHHLPDMDIAFNLNDECRVAVPWERLHSMQHSAHVQISSPRESLVNTWSENRAQGWVRSEIPGRYSQRLFIDYAFETTYDPIGRSLCPPTSKARTAYIWDKQTLCTTCARPHSLGQFLRRWELSGDICHQPDLAFMHGFFLSPASLKVSRKLLPIFSQSKVSGFNDILYPSSWNYLDKAKYAPSDEFPDPLYSEKEPTVFWRGTTSEGGSRHGTWKGMVRQRLIHLANNHTSKHVSVLLPAENNGKYAYKTFQGSELLPSLGLNTSIFIAESVARCGRTDCSAQTSELGTVPRTDFQNHWKYRFLFDMDGAGFSGRFLPFLRSRSLPFRTALFRQWLDSRLTPWLHFVPQDLRLHDFYSTLAYFAGARELDENGKTRKTIMKAHEHEGRQIAEEGKKWAEKALRKEDMEIYMFRLLLEWARLTDDRRDELGFSM
ncbi:hypothetical protein CPC735_070240 [Coccidioides posadasii C735 delta SOWgp]|uniref:Glycosyl transferase CAP10 domain-containing protein n=1 Tax=Coccidioides posadasii (strain C735) TaxID=222929 RepID=C5P0Y4_COCP7|nr:hypothetical protein CPC735_070240 [Coccidioides posadasii C735 delta SOWgp]EER29342.1 hypothetical protein CPC735_070240 [Coccidioides posadasii C735 delta SOWgp]|eukprot:XP_003071487.1 hypothetical protein CPC735_070240 [Coccidioides posadasii C735 delta SOWgp]